MKLVPEIKEDWVKRLRSGAYPQGKAYLNRNGAFCCLGVLCEIAYEQGIVQRNTVRTRNPHTAEEEIVIGYFPNDTAGEGSVVWTPQIVVDWAFGQRVPRDQAGREFQWDTEEEDGKLDKDYEFFMYVHPKASLGTLNDQRNYNFNQIADVIERDF